MTIIPDTTTDTTRKIAFHPLADTFPLMEGAEFNELVADIKANGLIYSIVTHEGMILDGRNRMRACQAAGVEPRFIPYDGFDPAEFVVSSNIYRRHLTAKDKRRAIAKLIKVQPEKSNNAIAKQVKADDKTVASVRHELEGRSEIPNVETTIDTKGRKQPKRKPRNPFFAKGAIEERQITKARKQPAKKGWSRERHQRHRERKRGRSIAGVTAAEKPTVLIEAWAVADREERREFVRVHSDELRGLLRELDEDKSVNAAVERAIARSEAQRPSIASDAPAVSTVADEWPEFPASLKREAS